MLNLDEKQGEISYYFKLFLHVIYELESTVHYLRDQIYSHREQFLQIVNSEPQREKRSFEKVYFKFDMNSIFEKLLHWFEERSQAIKSSTDSLKLIYYVRRMIFSLFDRENEYAYYQMRITRIYRKTSTDILTVTRLFKECQQLEHKIIDYDLEFAKYTLISKNAHEAYMYLLSKLDPLKKKCDEMFKASAISWMPQRVYERAVLLSLELQIKYDPKNPNIVNRFDNYIKEISKNQWEKPLFKYAQYLDFLDMNSEENKSGLPNHIVHKTEQQKADQRRRDI